MDVQDYLTSRQVAQETRMSRTWISSMCQAGKLRAFKHGKNWFIEPAAIAQIVALRRPPQDEIEYKATRMMAVLSEAWDIPLTALIGKCRAGRLSHHRQMLMYLLRAMTPLSYPEIGKLLDRDHSTVIHGCQLIQSRIDKSASFREMIEEMKTWTQERQIRTAA